MMKCRVEELMPLAKHKLELPHGWERIHQYIYVLQPNTDEHGYIIRLIVYVYVLIQICTLGGNIDQNGVMAPSQKVTNRLVVVLCEAAIARCLMSALQWMKVNSPGLDVRRRLWMITVVKRDDVVAAKRRLADALTNRTRHVVLEGELFRYHMPFEEIWTTVTKINFRQEPGALMKTWSKRWVTLYDDLIEV